VKIPGANRHPQLRTSPYGDDRFDPPATKDAGIMGFEIDFLPVGDGERCGDAIAVRYGEPGAYRVMVYDGGSQASGEALVKHVRDYYDTDYVHDVVNSHPDQDHASGLSVVLKELRVGKLWMHRPWRHSNLILNYFHDGRITSESLKRRLQEKMAAAHNLEQIAIKKGIPIEEPFQGTKIGMFHVLSPVKDWYVHELIADFEKSPEQKIQEATLAALAALDSARFGAFKRFSEAVEKAVTKWIAERWDLELLREDVETSAENESSVILYAYLPEYQEGVILTGDAGVRALKRSLDYLDACNVSASASIKFYQIPHHGSRHNVSTSVLDRLVRSRFRSEPASFEKTAFVSASEKSDYPRNMVKNAFLRRGASVSWTKGTTIRYFRDMPARGWGPVPLATFSPQVEAWD
jgi:beta-lactamase superfamily II metal-dependent hydrolase